ncbi:tRNA glutamyl-Q(34) synthetase GluQRS [Aliivibrio fischeri]|uniref:tRNA glutamyl-Q(34) synthetase GluQRS n=1 Tax=Aliivibrio fischeri TaxID=668 RepID=UPI00106050A6|nr:tRNA glutamyl-Q(34) synthetase GluQRS [Aliivibrio fischeri]TDM55216.1 tRNA glutamyl-Q(34) synthetase GluQRS [Aliivibrio fischeri]
MTTQYIGRFAPSPSGPLHFGSLVAALGSYLQAKSHQGKWLLRIEDLDPPREVPGAASLIIQTIENYGLEWDEEIVYQSQRHDLYQSQIDKWLQENNAYYCQCTRKQIKEDGGFYLGHCKDKHHSEKNSAVRLVMQHPVESFNDIKHGTITIPSKLAHEDFMIKRRDGLFAYNLAVVLDDIDQGVTEVVRGADLIEPTGRQISLYRQLGANEVSYLHLPLAVDEKGNKLSKQNYAPAIDNSNPKPTLLAALTFLGFIIPLEVKQATLNEILQWAIQHWQLNQLPTGLEITTPFSKPSI